MDWTIYRQDVMSGAPDLTRSVTVDRLEHTHWAAVFTAECGFFSAAHLKRLFPFPFPARIEGVIVRGNDDWDAFYD
jgi:hypothetical protein